MNKLQKVFQIVAQNGEFFSDFENAIRAAELAFKCAGYDVPGFAYMALTKSHAHIVEWMPRTAWANESENRHELDGWDIASGSAIQAPYPDHE